MEIGVTMLSLVVLCAAFVHGFCGFGYGILTMAGLSLLAVDFERASVFVTVSVLVLVGTLLLRSRRHMKVDWRVSGLVFIGLMVGSPIGYSFVYRCGSLPVFRLAFGIVLILFALNGVCRPHLQRCIHTALAPVFGFCSGLLSGAFASGGPPVVLYLYAREEDPRLALGSLQAVFLGAGLYRLLVVMAAGRGVGAQLCLQTLYSAPAVALGAAAGYVVARKVSVRRFLFAVYALMALAGIMNLVKALQAG